MNHEGIKDNPRMYEIIDILMDEYLEHNPTAATFVQKA